MPSKKLRRGGLCRGKNAATSQEGQSIMVTKATTDSKRIDGNWLKRIGPTGTFPLNVPSISNIANSLSLAFDRPAGEFRDNPQSIFAQHSDYFREQAGKRASGLTAGLGANDFADYVIRGNL
jgi:hypothetical protein